MSVTHGNLKFIIKSMSIRGLSKVPKKEILVIQDELSDLGKKLQKRRKDLGYTQESFAEEMDINVNSVKYIEQPSSHVRAVV